MTTKNSFSILKLERIQKYFGKQHVIRDVDLELKSGELFALLGPNGAGKSTTINMILGIEQPDSGNITLFNGPPTKPENRLHIGATPQNTNFPEFLKVREVIELVSKHFPNPMNFDSLVQNFGLDKIVDQLTGGLSVGQKRRLAIALAFIGNPKIVFLDEPTTGLDVESRKQLWEIIRNYVRNGGTIFLTTHYLEEAEQLASRIVVLKEGKIVASGSVSDIRSIICSTEIRFFSAPLTVQLEHVKNIELKEDCYIVHTNSPDDLVRELVLKNIPYKNLEIKKASLEDAFIEVIKRGEIYG